MPAITRLEDESAGHGFSARPNNQASGTVFVNGKGVHRQGDSWPLHCLGPVCHTSKTETGSSTVFINNVQCARIGDPLDCGDMIAQGSDTVFAGG